MRKKRERCSLKKEEIDDILMIRMTGRLDQEMTNAAVEETSLQKVALDLNRLEELKTKDLRFLLELSKKLKGQLSLFSEDSELIELIIMSGLDNQLLFRRNEGEAISALSDEEGE